MNQAANNSRLVFVSRSGEDTWVARQIANGISAAGARPFLDEADVEVGAEFEEDIRQFLDEAHELVVLFTPCRLRVLTYGRRSEPPGSAKSQSSSCFTDSRPLTFRPSPTLQSS